MKYPPFILLALLWAPLARAQSPAPGREAVGTSTVANPRGLLLLNPTVQLEATEAVNNLYNFKFEQAERDFRYMQFQYPGHPLPYFLLGLSEWWKIVPNIEDTQYDERCLAYMDSTIALAEKLLDEDDTNPEASFFMAGAYAFKGRLHAERSEWRKATLTGKNAIKYLKRGQGSELGPEFLFGDGLYNYYVEWVPENYKALKPIFWFFSAGDKKLGISQLEKVATNAFYTRTEAQYFLMRIYSDENQNDKAYEMAKYVANTYPDNAYFERYYARMAYVMGQLTEAERASASILAKIDQRMPGYEGTSGRYAAFYLGYIYQNYYRDAARAQPYYQRAVAFAEQTKALESGYYHLALAALARMADKASDYPAARGYFQKILDNTDRKSANHQEAKNYLADRNKMPKK